MQLLVKCLKLIAVNVSIEIKASDRGEQEWKGERVCEIRQTSEYIMAELNIIHGLQKCLKAFRCITRFKYR